MKDDTCVAVAVFDEATGFDAGIQSFEVIELDCLTVSHDLGMTTPPLLLLVHFTGDFISAGVLDLVGDLTTVLSDGVMV